jgi:UDP-glucose 4-epimerase
MNKILVTGGCGYIGSHTIVDLIQNGYDVISIDDNSRSNLSMLIGVENICGKKVKNYQVNLCNYDDTYAVFQENPDIFGVIHFAAFKAVGESVAQPLNYFDNNINSLINVLRCCNDFSIYNFVFSSSCTVYGNPDEVPVTEKSPIKKAESPYGYTKQVGEQIIEHAIYGNKMQAILLRYFNPVGAHPSIEIGELPIGKPANLVPAITQTAIGKLPQMQVFGNDYPTRDGSCIRDYIHVSDIAHAHTLAMNYLLEKRNLINLEIFNLGTGNGYTVLEVIKTFEKISSCQLNYTIAERRSGDVIGIFANNEKAKKELGWIPSFTLDQMMLTAWQWELKLNNNPL